MKCLGTLIKENPNITRADEANLLDLRVGSDLQSISGPTPGFEQVVYYYPHFFFQMKQPLFPNHSEPAAASTALHEPTA